LIDPWLLTIIISTCMQFNIPCAMFQSIAYVESRYNPSAESPGGDKGLYQIHPVTARRYLLDKPFNARSNSVVAARLIVDLKRRLKKWELVIRAYNFGASNVVKFADSGRYPSHSDRYLRKVKKRMAKIRVRYSGYFSPAKLFAYAQGEF